jgi:protease I
MRVLMVVPPRGFSDEEQQRPLRVLEHERHECAIASSVCGPCFSTTGARAWASLALDEVRPDEFDAVVFVGGAGARTLFIDADALRVAREFHRDGCIVAASGIAPVILARAGILTGRRATVAPIDAGALLEAHALLRALGVVVDGRIITASGPQHAQAFGERLARALADRARARRMIAAPAQPLGSGGELIH